MVGQAAEGLGADDVLIAGADQLRHLSGEEPALAHLVALADQALGELCQLVEGQGRVIAVVFQCADNDLLHLGDIAQNHIGDVLFQERTAIQPGGLAGVVGAVLHEAHQTRQVHLAVLGGQEVLQVVVAQGRVFHINFADHAHLDLGHPTDGDGGELRRDLRHGGLHLPLGEALARMDPAADGVQPFFL